MIEEAPAPGLPEDKRRAMHEIAVRLAKAINYRSLGTVEFLWDVVSGDFHFLEMNTRIQVEHPVTEMVIGLDLVELQIAIALGKPLPFQQGDLRITGHAIEARINAEEPGHDFRPSIGTIDRLSVPPPSPSTRIRFDSGVSDGSMVSPYYDSMIAKLIVAGPDRAAARQGLIDALDGLEVGGIATNISYLRDILASPEVEKSEATTGWLDRYRPAPLSERQLHGLLAAAAIDHVITIEQTHAAQGDDPWTSLGGWRLLADSGHPPRILVDLEDQLGGRHRVVVEGRKGRYAVGIGTPPVPVEARRTPEGLVLRAGDHVRTLSVSVDGAQVHVRSGRTSLPFRIADPRELDNVGRTAARGGDIIAALPGLIVEILASVGDAVEAGQPVIVMEAMKMMHGLSAPGPGIIAAIECKPGDASEMGQTLVRMQDADNI